jgi:hypothetical protein
MLYPKNSEKQLQKELFKNPTAEYRGTPFWSWNCKLDKELLLREIDQLKEMGMGGFHIHSRSGMATEYLGDEFMELVKASNDKAKENEMLCWLYDEDRWPSGFAGGIVTKEEKYRSRFLVFTTKEYDEQEIISKQYDSSAKAQRGSNRYLLAKYEVELKNGYLINYKKLKDEEEPKENFKVWRAYIEISGNNPWFNDQAYVNTLDVNAIKKFIEVTHEKYYEKLGHEFGKSIPAIFTDEPQFSHKQSFGYAEEEKDVILPFTDDFDETYRNVYGNSILDYLPELFWELPEGVISVARYRYHDHLSERFAVAFADTVGNWCKDHGIMLTGHMMSEPALISQTSALGEAMRSYRSFQLPGIDMLCDRREFSTAKQAQSAAHQYGCPGVLSELYGVTNWDFDFRGHKLQGDWQAALGITVRVHHLTWVSMGGEAKRDYPACIGYQSPWYKEYPLIEDHFSRLNTALTRGKAHVRVGVIHPVESYWLHWGPKEQTAVIREELESNFNNIINWLLYGLIDFDFISEALFKDLNKVEETSKLKVGEMNYDVIIVPACETLRSTTVDRLEAFVKAGGKVIFVGDPGILVDAVPSERIKNLSENSTVIPFTMSRVLQAVEPYREIDIRREDGARHDNLIYQMRDDGDNKWVFICHVNKMHNPDIASIENINIRLKGKWIPTIYNTMTGEVISCSSKLKGEETWINHRFSQHDSLLLLLESGEPKVSAFEDNIEYEIEELNYLKAPVPVTLSEPNVLLLDMAEFSFDNGEWKAKEEILKIDNEFRKKLDFPLRDSAMAQPWVNPDESKAKHVLSLKFIIESDIKVKEAYLALENAEATEIIINNVKIENIINGWYVDECIKKVKLPQISEGKTELILNIPFTSKTNVEWCYLLGDFGVRVDGSHAKIIDPVRELSFGDWTNQGLPFYAGNVTYHCSIEGVEGNLILEAAQFRNPLLSVELDDINKGSIAFAPYTIELGEINKNKHSIDITAFGNRINTFGTLHNCDHSITWFGPNAWRTTGNAWSYEYQLTPTGILVAPKVYIKK